MEKSPFLGLRTVIYPVADLQAAKTWYRQAFGIDPYFDEPFYVGFNIGGYELGLNPDLSEGKPGAEGSVTYWGVEACAAALERLRGLGAREHGEVQDVGGRHQGGERAGSGWERRRDHREPAFHGRILIPPLPRQP
jgi:catechol 2,3-dioxygenase-like lactoylglutathione lyase family enzyme